MSSSGIDTSFSLAHQKKRLLSIKREDVINTIKSRRLWESVLLGQVISILICGTGVTSQILSVDYKINIPTAQSFINYLLLAIVFNAVRQYQQKSRTRPLKFWTLLRERGLKYIVLAFIDVQANYLIVKAYQYTTLTSIQLLDCLVIPVVLILSALFLKIRYRISHLIGVLVCIAGVGFLIFSDLHQRQSSSSVDHTIPSNKFLGDMLCLVAACLYGVSNVAEEYFIRTFDRYEFLAMIGFFGTIINGIQFMIIEREEIQYFVHIKYDAILLVLLFSLLMFCFYYFMTIAIKATSATAVNLSILSADFYTLLFGIFLFKYQFNGLFLLAFIFIINGIIIYTLVPTTNVEDKSDPKSPQPRFAPCCEDTTTVNANGQNDHTNKDRSHNTLSTSLRETAIAVAGYEKMADEPLTELELGLESSSIPAQDGTKHPLAHDHMVV